MQPLGWIELTWQNLEVPGTGQRLTTFWAERGSRAAAALSYLAVAAEPAVDSRAPASGGPAVASRA
ncbi:hypothetical protein [Curtobacterium sp. PhB115]|uniref:hypothetical protein n=1 Tax=Curtobacterium sp. PhB115 TaxID=2485173 RepID=UPI0021A3DC24|nr:hypothetical protein [Curtobacterium sp. PhB115]